MSSRAPIALLHGHTKIFLNNPAHMKDAILAMQAAAAAAEEKVDQVAAITGLTKDVLQFFWKHTGQRHTSLPSGFYNCRGLLRDKTQKRVQALNPVSAFIRKFTQVFVKELLEAINKAILDMRADGTYKQINDKYFDFDIYGG